MIAVSSAQKTVAINSDIFLALFLCFRGRKEVLVLISFPQFKRFLKIIPLIIIIFQMLASEKQERRVGRLIFISFISHYKNYNIQIKDKNYIKIKEALKRTLILQICRVLPIILLMKRKTLKNISCFFHLQLVFSKKLTSAKTLIRKK